MSSEAPEIIFIRRSLKLTAHPHSGGVWKIAFADFMTAMMAFFLVMWLISATDKDTRKAVASYFNPVKLAEATVDKKGLRDPQEVEKDGKPEATQRRSSSQSDDDTLPGYSRVLDGQSASHEKRPRYSEAALFEDPYAVLAALVAGSEPGQSADNVGAFETRGQQGEPGLNGGTAQRDPFDPVYWKMSRTPLPQDGPETGGSATAGANAADARPEPTVKAESGAKPDAAVKPQVPAAPKLDQPAPTTTASKLATAAEHATPPVAGEAVSVVPPAALAALPASPPEARVSAAAPETRAPAVAAASADTPLPPDARPVDLVQGQPQAQAQALGKQLEAAIAGIHPAPGVQVTQTGEGLLVTLMDDRDFGMFAVGSAEPQPELIRAIDAIGKLLGTRPGGIIVRGHTDGRPFRSRDYDNWRLSTARAHMAYYMLVRSGVAENRFEKIEGYADHQLKRAGQPDAPQNRRIEILIRRPAP